MSSADAVAREAAWLRATGGGLPSLLATDGGPFDVVQAYLPRTPSERQSQLYVMRRDFSTGRVAQQRRMATHQFHLVCIWPIGRTTIGEEIGEAEQQAFDDALGLVVQRIEGYVGDKTHGGRFLAVAEGDASNGTKIDVSYIDPVQTFDGGYVAATITYSADDTEYAM